MLKIPKLKQGFTNLICLKDFGSIDILNVFNIYSKKQHDEVNSFFLHKNHYIDTFHWLNEFDSWIRKSINLREAFGFCLIVQLWISFIIDLHFSLADSRLTIKMAFVKTIKGIYTIFKKKVVINLDK